MVLISGGHYIHHIKKMKIGIDASSITKEKVTGVENYVRSLVLALNDLQTGDNFSLYAPADFFDFPKLNSNFDIVKKPSRKYWGQFTLPRLINKNQPDVVFFPSNIIAPFIRTKVVYHFHDLAWHFYPKAYSREMRMRQYLAVKRAKMRAEQVIVSSRSSKNDLVKYFEFDTDKITVIPFGYDRKIKKYRLSEKNRSGIVSVGRLESRKNTIRLLEAYKLYAAAVDRAEELTLIGNPGYGFEEIQSELDRSIKSGFKVKWLSGLDNEEYYKILGQSKVLLYPTLYEGFGLPILEAFAGGAAVLSSDTSSIPEITEDGALLVDPEKTGEIAKALKMLCLDDSLRTKIIKYGDHRLKDFSWEKCAASTLKVLEDVAKQT